MALGAGGPAAPHARTRARSLTRQRGSDVYITFNCSRARSQLDRVKANQSLVFQGLNAEISRVCLKKASRRRSCLEISIAQIPLHNIFLVDLGDGRGQMKIRTRHPVRCGKATAIRDAELHLQTVRCTRRTRPANCRTSRVANPAPRAAFRDGGSAAQRLLVRRLPRKARTGKERGNGDHPPPYTVARSSDWLGHGGVGGKERRGGWHRAQLVRSRNGGAI